MTLHNPHDKLFKAILEDKTLAAAYFRHFLPEELVRALDFESIQLSTGSYIDDRLNASFADVVFTCLLKSQNKSIDLAILIEHKSYVDKNAPFQLLYYVASAWMQALARKQEPKLVIPVLFYHGVEPWEYAGIETFFRDLPDDLYVYLPKFDFVYNNLQSISDDQIWALTNSFLAASFLTMKHYRDNQWLEKNFMALISQNMPEGSNLYWQYLVYFFNFVQLNQQEIMNKLATLPPKKKKEIMTTYEMILEEGRQEGRQEGRSAGEVKKTTEVVILSYKKGLEIGLIADITNLSLEDVQQILKEHGI